MDFPDLVDHACIKQNPFGQRGLARINVSGDSNVACSLEWELAVGRIQIRRHWFFFERSRHVGLPAEMSEGAIGLCHFVGVIALLDCVALTSGRVL